MKAAGKREDWRENSGDRKGGERIHNQDAKTPRGSVQHQEIEAARADERRTGRGERFNPP